MHAPLALLAAEYAYPSAWPVVRPISPCRLGPVLCTPPCAHIDDAIARGCGATHSLDSVALCAALLEKLGSLLDVTHGTIAATRELTSPTKSKNDEMHDTTLCSFGSPQKRDMVSKCSKDITRQPCGGRHVVWPRVVQLANRLKMRCT